jgi:hypothetical protein
VTAALLVVGAALGRRCGQSHGQRRNA